MTNSVISVKGLGKKYRVGTREKQTNTIFGAIAEIIKSPWRNYKQIRGLARTEKEESSILWALRNISFEVQEGQVLGIIGHNGAGKSTLLKILSRITDPTEGEIMIRGRVSSLLEVGTGFHPELTGRDNVYMNGTILGMTKKEIDRKFDEILEFSGVEKYIDTPVKFYSSGMKVRLAFSVAAHLDPEILIIDEVLAVGDAEFQKRCLQKMDSVAGQGRTILFVSHDLGAIQNLCQKTILLSHGTIALHDETRRVIEAYLGGIHQKGNGHNPGKRYGIGNIKVESVQMLNESMEPVLDVMTGQTFYVQLCYRSGYNEDLPAFTYFHIFFKSATGTKLFTLSSRYSKSLPSNLKGQGMIKCLVKHLPLLPGKYYLDVCCKLSEDIEDYREDVTVVSVVSGMFPGYSRLPNSSAGMFLTEHVWSADQP